MLNRKRRHALSASLSVALVIAMAVPAFADETSQDLRNQQQDLQNQQAAVEAEQADTSAKLDDIKSNINDLEAKKNDLLGQIDSLDAQLVTTIASINTINSQISEKEKDLEQTAADLQKARENADTEYEAMKARIQYLYEKGGETGWPALLLSQGADNSDVLSDVLDKADFTGDMYKYDRQCLEEYANDIQTVSDLQTQQQQEEAALVEMKNEQESQEANLQTLKEQAQASSEDAQSQINQAEELASQYTDLINQQNAKISELSAAAAAKGQEADQKAAEEQAAAEEAQRQAEAQAAAEAAAQAEAAAAQASTETTTSGSSSSADTGYTGSDSSSDTTYTDSSSGSSYTDTSASSSASGSSSSGSTVSSSSSSSATGAAIAAYACQFVGNPYVWGGTSLTNGCDCSGFVQSVYAHFGISLSRTTYTQANEGVAVSYSDMQPGDVINYGFHTAIYIGNNQIVHAADSSLGIIIQSNPAFQPIVTIRRFV